MAYRCFLYIQKHAVDVFVHSLIDGIKKLYKERIKLKGVRIPDVFPSYPSNGQQRQRIFINENLTAYRRRIVKEANKRRQEGSVTRGVLQIGSPIRNESTG